MIWRWREWIAGLAIVGECEAFSAVLAGSKALANPKSGTLTAPSSVILMFAGLRSR